MMVKSPLDKQLIPMTRTYVYKTWVVGSSLGSFFLLIYKCRLFLVLFLLFLSRVCGAFIYIFFILYAHRQKFSQ